MLGARLGFDSCVGVSVGVGLTLATVMRAGIRRFLRT